MTSRSPATPRRSVWLLLALVAIISATVIVLVTPRRAQLAAQSTLLQMEAVHMEDAANAIIALRLAPRRQPTRVGLQTVVATEARRAGIAFALTETDDVRISGTASEVPLAAWLDLAQALRRQGVRLAQCRLAPRPSRATVDVTASFVRDGA